MGWDRGKYYSRSKKVNGRVVREYVGTGYLAELTAQLDEIERERKRLKTWDDRLEIQEFVALDDEVKESFQVIERAARAALLAAGFHRHKRGEWRKTREKR